jgi:hypothetical protein
MKLSQRELRILLASVTDSIAELSNHQATTMDDMIVVSSLYVKLAHEFKKNEQKFSKSVN